MKKKLQLFALLVICLCALPNVFGQIGADSKSFREIHEKSQKLLNDKSHRIKTTTEIFDDKSSMPKTKIESVYAVVPPDRWHYSSTTLSGGKTQKTETIEIGDRRFIKSGDENWKVDNSEPMYGLMAENSADDRFIEKTTFNGQTVNIYERKTNRYSDRGDRKITTRYWFNEEGYLLKSEAEEIESKTNEISRIVKIYEYDPKDLKIEAPLKP